MTSSFLRSREMYKQKKMLEGKCVKWVQCLLQFFQRGDRGWNFSSLEKSVRSLIV